ncbi:DegT/DnrJ/EryC1/StrS family aminotransferase [Anoxynatronum sibiricum]|uniref:DegT/DnrJ/EryC1/StrS family aminotransferase n=2 Tax=Anoxynatronum sibiricum TaxID=210623 RepID=A0ABU9VUV1_9CLOT
MEFRDLKQQYTKYQREINAAIQRVLDRGVFIGGEEVEELEKNLAAYVGVKHCISCANGTEAMTLVLMAWNIGPGDAVFVPDFTFFSTAEVVAFLGATPIFVDVKWETFNMDPYRLKEAIEKVIQEKKLTPKAVIPVDLFGLPAEHEAIRIIAKEYALKVLEDGAQGFGGRIGEKKAGSFGDAATTSFFPAKPLGCYGDGGAIFTKDDKLSQQLHSLKVHGKGDDKYDNVRIGVNSRLDTLQAAILQVKLNAFADHELEAVKKVGEWYAALLKDMVEIPVIPVDYGSSYAQYTIKLKSRQQRDHLQQFLKGAGIPAMIYYQKPLHQQTAFSVLNEGDGGFEMSNRLSQVVLSLPIHPYLLKTEVEFIADKISEYLKQEAKHE